jgi:arginyl-tRNA synthetase
VEYSREKAEEECLKALGLPEKEGNRFFAVPKSEEHGDLACAIAFSLAKKERKSPKEIAEDIALKLSSFKLPASIEKIEAKDGFVNFFFSNGYYAQSLSQALELKEKFGEGDSGKGKKIVVEFSQPNVGKPFHVGHIRSTILGDAVANLKKSQGWKTVRMNYLGDSGTQVAKLLLALELFKEKLPEVKDEKTMLEYYVKIHKEIEAKPEVEEKAKEYLEKIEDGDSETIKKVEFIRKKSYEAFQRNYDLLGVKFDVVTGESEFVKSSKKIVVEALKKKIAFVDKGGETVVKLEHYGLPNFIVLRSNGTTLYTTRDLGLADYKFEKFGFDSSVILTAAEQNLHFKQVIKTLELLGRKYAQNYKHVGFGLISLQEGKLSTREGRVVFLEDVISETVKAALHELTAFGWHAKELNSERIDRITDYTNKEKTEIAKRVGIGSLKFSILRITPEKNILFNPKTAVSFAGDTGAYAQYTCVRAKSILEKAKEEKAKIPSDLSKFGFNREERGVTKLIAEYPIVLKNASNAMQPHQLCDFILRLSAAFNEFYHAHSVLKAEKNEEKPKRLALVKATALVLENALSLLGIKVPEKM